MKFTLSKSGLLLPERKIQRAPASDFWRQGPNPRWDEKRVRDYCERQRHEKRWKPQLITRGNVGAKHAAGTGVGSLATSAFATTSGNLIVVMIRSFDSSITSIVDTASNSYSLIASDVSGDPWLHCYVAQDITGHVANVVTVTWAATGTYRWVDAIEYTGCATALATDVTDNNTGTGTTDITSNSFTTVQSVEVVVAGASQSGLATYTAGADFTLVSGSVDGGGFGGVQEYITSSILSSYTAHITSTTTAGYTMLTVSFKAAAAGGGKPMLYYQTQAQAAGGM